MSVRGVTAIMLRYPILSVGKSRTRSVARRHLFNLGRGLLESWDQGVIR